MNSYTKYINALRECAKEYKNDTTPFAHIIVSDLCSDVADLLERLEQESTDTISRKVIKSEYKRKLEETLKDDTRGLDLTEFADCTVFDEFVDSISSVDLQPKTGHWTVTGDYQTGAYGTIDRVKCSCCYEDSLEEGDYCPN